MKVTSHMIFLTGALFAVGCILVAAGFCQDNTTNAGAHRENTSQDDENEPTIAGKAQSRVGPQDGVIRFKTMRFKRGVSIGDPVTTDCTTRCHIDYPFTASDQVRFRHSNHRLEQGFQCTLCHSAYPLTDARHGQLTMTRAGCRSCHHDSRRFTECKTCHESVTRPLSLNGVPFDHQVHVAKGIALACSDCHSDTAAPRKMDPDITCQSCHHIESVKPDCKSCHGKALESGRPSDIKGFDHGHHASSDHLRMGCKACHLPKVRFGVPETLDCDTCHHGGKNKDPENRIKCIICHDPQEIRVSRAGPRRLPFHHLKHVSAGIACDSCHDETMHVNNVPADERGGKVSVGFLNPGDGGMRRMDCGGCHHQRDEGCTACHVDPLRFTRYQELLPGGNRTPFRHDLHARYGRCDQCHGKGKEIRIDFEKIDCAVCHHYGADTGCGVCHHNVETIRMGTSPCPPGFHPEPMQGILACADCHPFDAEAPHGLEPGTAACTRCHPASYGDLVRARLELLEKGDPLGSGLSPSVRIHHFEAFKSASPRRKRDAEKETPR